MAQDGANPPLRPDPGPGGEWDPKRTFKTLVRGVAAPLLTLDPRSTSIGELATRYARCHEALETRVREVRVFVEQILRTLVEVKCETFRPKRDPDAVTDGMWNELRRKHGLAYRQNREALACETAAQGNRVALSHYARAIALEVQRFAKHFHARVESLDEAGLLGSVTCYDNAIVKLTYPKRMAVIRDQQVQHQDVNHEHRLCDTQWHRLATFGEPVPPNIESLFSAVPAWLEPEIAVVTGTQFFGRIVARDAQRQQLVPRRDPAIVLAGRYVLAGWSDMPTAPTNGGMRKSFRACLAGAIGW